VDYPWKNKTKRVCSDFSLLMIDYLFLKIEIGYVVLIEGNDQTNKICFKVVVRSSTYTLCSVYRAALDNIKILHLTS